MPTSAPATRSSSRSRTSACCGIACAERQHGDALVTRNPDRIESWSAHFWSVRRWFFTLNIITGLATPATTGVIDDRGLGVRSIPPAIVIVLSLLGRVSANERVHGFGVTFAGVGA